MAHPVRTNKIPRQVPAQAWYMHPLFSILIGGILPFGAVFIELFFILTSMWLHQVCASPTLHPPCRMQARFSRRRASPVRRLSCRVVMSAHAAALY